MNARRISKSGMHYNGIPPLVWLALFAVGMVVLAFIEYGETDLLIAGGANFAPFILHLAGYANLLLVGSALLYVVTSWFGSELTGRLASNLATIGAAVALVALLVRWVETYYLQRPGHPPQSIQFEMLALVNAITVVVYLIMERIYRSRSAGAFVMMIVVAAALFQTWLAAYELSDAEHAIATLRTYWMMAHVLSNFVGYGGFAAAAAMAIAFLIHGAADQRISTLQQPTDSAGLPQPERLMYHAVLLGFVAFTLGTILGVMWALHLWGRHWEWEIKEAWALAVLLPYASFLWLRYVHGWTGKRMAWLAIGSFGIAVLCLIAANQLGFASFSRADAHAHIEVQGTQ